MVSGSTSDESAVYRDDDLLIPVGGETVAASRYAPPDSRDPRPSLLMYIPYHKDVFTPQTTAAPLVEYLARSGYNVVTADVVGTGASSGVKPKPGSMDEGHQAVELIDWLVDQPWATDSVGMFGISYGATTSLKAAALNPDHLDAIVPIHGPHTQYRDTYQGGAFAFYRMGSWTTYMQVLQALPPTRRDDEGRWADIWRRRLDSLEDHDPWLFDFLEHEAKDDYWTGTDVAVENIRVPTFAVCGWRDRYARSTTEYYDAIDAPKRLLLGPWRHEMPHRGRESAIDFRPQVVEWFDHHLTNAETAVPERPDIAVWTERDGGGEIDAGHWRELKSWPVLPQDEAGEATADVDEIAFSATPDGLLATGEFVAGTVESTRAYDHSVGLNSPADVYVASEPADTTADDVRSITFETDPLESPTELTGTGAVDLQVSATTSDPYLVARVVDVAPDGVSTLVTHGELWTVRRNGFQLTDDLAPGESYTITVPLKPKSHVFEAGHRIRLAVSAAYFPLNLPPGKQGKVTLWSSPRAPTTLRFPGRRLSTPIRFTNEIEMGSPDESIPPVPQRVHGDAASWTVSRDHLDESATLRTTTEYRADLPHGDLAYESVVVARVRPGNPGSARLETDITLAFDDGARTTTVEGTSRVTRDTTSLDVRVLFDDHVQWSQCWYR